ncbi:hypothetical protein [Lacipirellula sp.]|uniref:hypothetical protein n=1 Tax=Lacipirellula sp. TaxID=2691419 RepID=UPI003D0DEF33
MSEVRDARDAIDRKRIENRKLLDAAELVIFGLAIPEKAKLLCLYFLRTCDWLTLTRDEGRAVLARILGCSEDQVSRYTRPLDQFGIVKIVGRGSNLTGMVHTYRIELDHKFWSGSESEVCKLVAELRQRIRKGKQVDPLIAELLREDEKDHPKESESVEQPRTAYAADGLSTSRGRLLNQPLAATQPAADAALPLLLPSSPSPPTGREGGNESEPEALPPLPVSTTQVTDKELEGIVQTHRLVKPDDLIDNYYHSRSWTEQLRYQVRLRFAGHYVLHGTNGRYDYCSEYCPNDANIIAITLRNLVNASPDSPLSLEIKHLYPDMWPSASSGDLAIDEEKAALDWLKDANRSGTHSDFLNSKRDLVLNGGLLSPKQLAAVMNNWRRSTSVN